ncbi:Limb region 1 -like protein [Branchiostoma belcheri]|nr:Limb region 1 -like protein [Branchiostoma belcheri]
MATEVVGRQKYRSNGFLSQHSAYRAPRVTEHWNDPVRNPLLRDFSTGYPVVNGLRALGPECRRHFPCEFRTGRPVRNPLLRYPCVGTVLILGKDIGLGQASLSMFGVLGASVEIVLILYLMVASVVGFYSVPLFSRIRPTKASTPMTMVIANCLVLLTMSSALPVLSRTIGITHFDLLGYFGRFNWLGNFYIVLLYNVVFAVGTGLCLVKKFSVSVRRELYARLRMYSPVTRRRQSRTESMSVAHTANGMTATMAASLNPANETGAATATGSNSTNENLSNGTAHSIKSD